MEENVFTFEVTTRGVFNAASIMPNVEYSFVVIKCLNLFDNSFNITGDVAYFVHTASLFTHDSQNISNDDS